MVVLAVRIKESRKEPLPEPSCCAKRRVMSGWEDEGSALIEPSALMSSDNFFFAKVRYAKQEVCDTATVTKSDRSLLSQANLSSEVVRYGKGAFVMQEGGRHIRSQLSVRTPPSSHSINDQSLSGRHSKARAKKVAL